MPHQHMHTKSMPGKRQMGGRNWPFGHGGHEGHGNQNPRLNQRSEGSNGGSEGDTGTTAKPAPTAKPTANPTANSPGTTQRQTIVHTSILDLSPSVTVVLGETTFATHYTDFDTLAIDTQAITFSSGPQPTSGAGGSNNLNSGSINMNQNGGANGTANKQGSDGGLGGGAIAGIIVGVVLLLVISLVILFFRKRVLARRNNSPYGKHNQEETRSSLLDTGLAASVGAGAAAVGARSGHGAGDASSAAAPRNTPAQPLPQQQPLMQQTNNSQYLVPASSRSALTTPRPAPPPPQSNHSSNPSRSRLSIISPPPTHISSTVNLAFTPGAVSPISPVSPAVIGPPSPPSPDDRGGENGGRRTSIGSVSTLSIHSAMMTASQLNWPMPPSVASTSSPSVPLSATPSASRPVPAPHYVDFEEQGRTVVRINRESLSGGIGSAR